MGFRTVVVLNNDQSHDWENDPELGRKIWLAAASCGRERFHYGGIVEQVHADCQTLAVLDGYDGKPIAHTHWYREQSDEVRNLALLKALAEQLGYRVSKKPTKEPK